MFNILYIHGLGSSAASHTILRLKEIFPGKVFAFDIPVNPVMATEAINDFVSENSIGLVVGTSLGGFYAEKVQGVMRLLINPALRPDEEIPKLIPLGEEVSFFNDRADGSKTYVLTEQDMNEFKQIRDRYYEYADHEDKMSIRAIFGTQDGVVNDLPEFDAFYGSQRRSLYDFGHRLNDEVIEKVLVPEIAKMEELKAAIEQIYKNAEDSTYFYF